MRPAHHRDGPHPCLSSPVATVHPKYTLGIKSIAALILACCQCEVFQRGLFCCTFNVTIQMRLRGIAVSFAEPFTCQNGDIGPENADYTVQVVGT